jgi:hypothetical protein
MVLSHSAKIQRELNAAKPRHELIAYWERRIRDVEQKTFRLEEKLGKH